MELVSLWPLYRHQENISGHLLRVLLLFSSFSAGRKLLRWCKFFLLFLGSGAPEKPDDKSASMFMHRGCSLASPTYFVFFLAVLF